jgi:hypothetical protein
VTVSFIGGGKHAKKEETIRGCTRGEREINLIKTKLKIKREKMRREQCQYKEVDNCRH